MPAPGTSYGLNRRGNDASVSVGAAVRRLLGGADYITWTSTDASLNSTKDRIYEVTNLDTGNDLYVATDTAGDASNAHVTTSAGKAIAPGQTVIVNVPKGDDVFAIRAAGSGNVFVQEWL